MAAKSTEESRWSLGRCVLLGFLVWFVPINVVAGDTAEQVVRKLAGTHGKEWVFKKWETFLGPGNRCTKGESYRFTTDQHVTISRCVDGHIQSETKPWSIDLQDPPDTKL